MDLQVIGGVIERHVRRQDAPGRREQRGPQGRAVDEAKALARAHGSPPRSRTPAPYRGASAGARRRREGRHGRRRGREGAACERLGWSQQGANLVGNFNSSIGDTTYNNTQDFFDPFLDVDYSPLIGEVRHRVTGTTVYDIPWLADRGGVLGAVLGGWQLSSVLNFRSGEPLRITQASGIGNSRPDYNGGQQVFNDWRDTLQYLDRNAYTLVPISPTTRATVRPGTQNSSQVRGPGRRRVDLTIAKAFRIGSQAQLQVRFESFNAFNWRQYNNPSTSITSPTFGQITSVASTRTGQVGLRLTF